MFAFLLQCDLKDRKVTIEEIEELYQEHNFIGWTETSAKVILFFVKKVITHSLKRAKVWPRLARSSLFLMGSSLEIWEETADKKKPEKDVSGFHL